MKKVKQPPHKCQVTVDAAFEQASHDNFGVMFASVVGSQNYGMATEKSDIDMKVIIYPGFASYWNHSFPTGKVKLENSVEAYDVVTVHDWYHNGVLKGNINFFEPLYSKFVCYDKRETEKLMFSMREVLEGNVITVIQAQFWTAYRHLEDFIKNVERENQVWERENLGYNAKSAANAFRLLKFTEKFYNFGEIDIQHVGGSALNIRNGGVPKDELLSFLPQMFNEMGAIYFDGFESKSKTTPSAALIAKDKTNTTDWQARKAEIDLRLMKNNLELIRN